MELKKNVSEPGLGVEETGASQTGPSMLPRPQVAGSLVKGGEEAGARALQTL